MLLRTLSTALAATTALFAQNDYNLDKLTAGTLGSPLNLAVAAAPANALGLWLVSFTSGPTPLAAFDPADARSVQVGTDLSAVWTFYVTSGTGTGSFSLALPSDPSFTNLIFHWQNVTLATGGPTIVGQISNAVRTQASVAGTGLLAPASLATARAFSAAFVDANNNAGQGDVVVAGGGTGTLTAATGLASTEVWDFRGMRRVAGPNMGSARALHVAVPLADNRVLVVGGVDAVGAVLSSCEIYDPVTNTFGPAASMAQPRVLHAAVRLADGRVLVAGGTTSLVDTTAAITNVQSTTEIFDPVANTWTPAAAMGGRRLGPALTRLPSGQILVSGGVEVTLFLGVPISAFSTTACQRYNPGTNTWGSAGSMSQGRAGHHFNQVTMADGRVLMTGGVNVPNLLGAASAAPINGAEAYNPTTNAWATFNMPVARALHSATVVGTRVLVCGGAQGTLTAPTSIANVDVFDSVANSWSSLPALTGARSGHAAMRTPDGTVLLFGGQGASTTLATIETVRL
jgi:hypothetical protein